MTLMALLIRLRACGVGLYIVGDRLRVSAPEGSLSEEVRRAMETHKDALMRLPHPYLNAAGELIMPCYAPPQYHWQPKDKTLRELNASPEVWRRHTLVPYSPGLPTESDEDCSD